jgi:hypothetical protein
VDPLSSITFTPADPAPVMRAAPGARVSRDGGRRGQGGDPDTPPQRQRPDGSDDEQPAAEFVAAPEAADAGRRLDVIADDPAGGDTPQSGAGTRIDLTA